MKPWSVPSFLWLLLAIGVALMLIAAGTLRAEETVNRTERISATLAPGTAVRIENVSGDVVATAGPQFSVVAKIVVVAPTKERAEEILGKVRLLQLREGDEFSIATMWPESRWRFDRERLARRRLSARCDDCRINARFDVTIPPGVAAALETVNGDVVVKDLDGDLDLETVNGKVEAQGVRRSLEAHTVNGNLVARAVAARPGSSIDLQTVNGAVTLTLPKDARFDVTASTMHGSIASTFALPRRAAEAEDDRVRNRKLRRMAVEDREDGTAVVDLRDLEKELDRSMKDVDIEIRDSMRAAEEAAADAVREGVREGVAGGVRDRVRGGIRGGRTFRILDPRRSYSGRIGEGGTIVRLAAMNGSILLLASGSRPEDARPVVSERQSFAVTIPKVVVRTREVKVRVPQVSVVPRVPPAAPPAPAVEVPEQPGVHAFALGAPVVRGNIAGDFLSTSGTSSYRLGDVSGRVWILTHAGEIVVGSVGAGADVKTLGGDIRIGAVKGDLGAQTLAGNVRASSVTGAARVETSGGDIRLGRVDGVLRVRTGGGDIVVPTAAGAVAAVTAGGDVRIAIASRQLKNGVTIQNGGGDVTLTLPSDFRGDFDLTVTESDPSEPAIRSDFPEISISRREGVVRGNGTVNGGGEKVRIQTTSGTIRLRRGPAAGR
ncbi:MAG: hypothetical protein DMF54_02210 [Acidobacteria bacterium]|nr:MAG: hypothetical protein DMF54_02210 [Acidobacteriota bacterium]